MNLAGRTAVVTGAGSGIGRAIAVSLAALDRRVRLPAHALNALITMRQDPLRVFREARVPERAEDLQLALTAGRRAQFSRREAE